MPFAIPSDDVLRWAFWSGVTVSLFTVLLLVLISLLRLHSEWQRRCRLRTERRWQPVFFARLSGHTPPLPPIALTDKVSVLELWLQTLEMIKGPSRYTLQLLGIELNFPRTALGLLRSSRLRDQLLGTAVLGHLGDHPVWGDIAPLVRDPHPVLSLAAMRSLLQIDPRRAAPILMEHMLLRDDWSIRQVIAALQDVDGAILVPSVLHALRMAREEHLPRLLPVVALVPPSDVWPRLMPLLEHTQSPDILSAALKACRHPYNLPMIRGLVSHSFWSVRAQAMSALGRLGGREEMPLLIAGLADREWWVRYRAARALVSLPVIPHAELQGLLSELSDPFAADILQQALAETARRTLT